MSIFLLCLKTFPAGLTDMNTGPVIGIMGNRIPNESRLFYGMERDYVNHDYVEAVERCGGSPSSFPSVTPLRR